MKRYFEFIGTDGKTDVAHSKFWEVWVEGSTLRSRYGKIGATGQTTVKDFASVEDAEVAMTKAIAEKTKKGYTEPARDEDANDADDEGEDQDVPPRLDENDSEAISATAAYDKWASTYEPIAYISLWLTEIPAGVSEEFIWSERNGDVAEYLTKGFQAYQANSNEPVTGFVITKNPIHDMEAFEYIVTEIRRYCEACDGQGEVDGEDCQECDGAGTQYFEVPTDYPLVIDTQEELDAFTASGFTPGEGGPTAEDMLVELAEQPDLGSPSWEATNTLVFSHLIPARRFAEARLWLEDLIGMEVGYESWNAVSNLGVVEFESGHTDLARSLFESMIDAGEGPLDEAEEYLERINAGETRPLDTRADWDFSDKWQQVDVSKPLKGKHKPQDLYLRIIKLLDVKDTWETMQEPYAQSPAASIYGLANGFDEGLRGSGIEVDREVVVRACTDYLVHVAGAKKSLPRRRSEKPLDASTPEAKFCTSCGTARPDGAKFCASCGERF
jgi:predicted DNA-binding WGR domain protein